MVTELWCAQWVNTTGSQTNMVKGRVALPQQKHPLSRFRPPDSIRRWGCNRTETPLIFVHIGKAGGGSVGARIEAGSLNYTKPRPGQVDYSYYPLSGGKKARFVASSFTRHLPSQENTYERTTPCHASTPLGQAIGCPENMQRIREKRFNRQGECHPFSETCHLVYMGHNFFGSEMHWLPVKYLQKWWATLQQNGSEITPLWNKLLPGAHGAHPRTRVDPLI